MNTKSVFKQSTRLYRSIQFAVICLAIILLGPNLSAEPGNPATAFQWDDQQVDINYCYHYQFSDLDSKAPHDFYLYFPDTTRLQILKK